LERKELQHCCMCAELYSAFRCTVC